MIAERDFTRGTILERLNATLRNGQPILAVAAGVGIVAKCAEASGADLILVLASSKSRHLGVPTTTHMGNATTITLDMYPEIDNIVETTPIVGGAEATDGSRRRLPRTIDTFRRTGFDGISNFPTTGTFPGWGEARRDVGEGTDREYELIELARAQDYFTVAHAYVPEHATHLARSGADVLVGRCGLTIGGRQGPTGVNPSHQEAAEHLEEIFRAARQENPDVILLGHGGPFADPDDTDYLYEHTSAQGFLAESSVERIALERYIEAEVADFKNQTIRDTARVNAPA